MKYIIICLVVVLVATYGFQLYLPTGHGVLKIGSEYQKEERKESKDGDLPEYR